MNKPAVTRVKFENWYSSVLSCSSTNRVQRAAFNLIDALVSFDRENEYYIFTELDENPAGTMINVHLILPIYAKETFAKSLVGTFTYKLTHKHQVDLLHSP